MSKSDQFDFLIDVVPREDATGGQASVTAASKGKKKSDEVRIPPVSDSMIFSPQFVQPPSRDETTGDQLEGDSQVTQALSLEHVGAFSAIPNCSMLTHYLLLDKFHARLWIRIWGRFLGVQTHILTLDRISCPLYVLDE